MAEEKVMVEYICSNCKLPFKAPQGSRKYYCPTCLAKAVARELPKKD